MTDCKTEATGMSIADNVLNKTKQITKEIEKPDPDGYGKDPTRFTNIQAGLQLANDLLYNNSEIKNIQNKYIIFLSDGYRIVLKVPILVITLKIQIVDICMMILQIDH